MSIFKFKKGTHVDHFFDAVGPTWYHLWGDDDLITSDFEIEIKITITQKSKTETIDPIDQCEFCSGTGIKPVLDGGNNKRKCLVCSGTGHKRKNNVKAKV